MTPEELMMPRYEVIADYPYNPWLVGEVLSVDEKGELVGQTTGYPDYAYMITEKDVAHYPSIFRRLGWWEKREESDMPEYVRRNELNPPTLQINGDLEPMVHKIKKQWSMGQGWRNSIYTNFISEWENYSYPYSAFIPATQTEYEQQ